MIQIPAVPNLPLPSDEFSKLYLNQLTNVLRLYFNQLGDAVYQSANLQILTVETLPNATTAGAGSRAFVTDSSVTTFASIVAGGGSNTIPVYSDGVNWRAG